MRDEQPVRLEFLLDKEVLDTVDDLAEFAKTPHEEWIFLKALELMQEIVAAYKSDGQVKIETPAGYRIIEKQELMFDPDRYDISEFDEPEDKTHNQNNGKILDYDAFVRRKD